MQQQLRNLQRSKHYGDHWFYDFWHFRPAIVYIHTPLGGDGTLTLYRQNVFTDAGGSLTPLGRDDKPIMRRASQIATQSVTVGGKTYTGAEVMEVLAAFFDLFDAQDHAPPAEPAPAEQGAAP